MTAYAAPSDDLNYDRDGDVLAQKQLCYGEQFHHWASPPRDGITSPIRVSLTPACLCV